MKTKKKLELYIHIPFCVKKCLYCDFLSGPCNVEERNEYIEALIEEIRYSLLDDEDLRDSYEVVSIFFGGGTPSLLSASQMDNIMDSIRSRFSVADDAEITIECNPKTVDQDKMNSFKAAGINRVSIGLQSANDEELKNLGRIHTYEDFKQAIEIVRNSGIDNINIDVMSAIPGQTIESYKDTLEKVISFKPNHISAYSLIIEEGTPYYLRYGDMLFSDEEIFAEYDEKFVNNLPDLPDEDTEREMYYLTEKLLKENGYHRYEISNYSLEGKECIHNKGYWTGTEYLAFGLGASAYYKKVRYSNTSDMMMYIQKCKKLAAPANPSYSVYLDEDEPEEIFDYPGQLKKEGFHEAIQLVSEKEAMEEFMYLGLRLIDGVSKEEFYKRFTVDFDSVYGSVVDKNVKLGLLEVNGDNIRFTSRGIDISNSVLSNFLL